MGSGTPLESGAGEGDSPLRATMSGISGTLSRPGHEEPWSKQRGPSRKAKYYRETDSVPVP